LLVVLLVLDVLHEDRIRLRVAPLREPVRRADSNRAEGHAHDRHAALEEGLHRRIDLLRPAVERLLEDRPARLVLHPPDVTKRALRRRPYGRELLLSLSRE